MITLNLLHDNSSSKIQTDAASFGISLGILWKIYLNSNYKKIYVD